MAIVIRWTPEAEDVRQYIRRQERAVNLWAIALVGAVAATAILTADQTFYDLTAWAVLSVAVTAVFGVAGAIVWPSRELANEDEERERDAREAYRKLIDDE